MADKFGGDLINLSGKNGVRFATCLDNVWQEESKLVEDDSSVITSAQIGKVSDEICLAYITDKDGNVETGTDGILNVLNVQDGVNTVVDKESDSVSDVSFVNIGGENVIAYSSSKGYGYTDKNNYISLMDDITGYTDFQIVSGQEKDLVIAQKSVESGTELYAAILKDGKLSTPVPITEQSNYAGNVSGVCVNNEYYFAYVQKNCNFSQEDMQVESKLCGMRFSAYTQTDINFFFFRGYYSASGRK